MCNSMSYPARGMWIEICPVITHTSSQLCRTPRGVCGLKFKHRYTSKSVSVSYPARGMWIEICTVVRPDPEKASYPARGMWIEIIFAKINKNVKEMSYLARGMWIEIAGMYLDHE